MPRTDHDDSRKWLREQLEACGFSADAAEIWIERFTNENVTAKHVSSMSLLLFEAQAIFPAERQKLADELQAERKKGESILNQIKSFVRESINALNAFANQAETAGKLGLWLSPEHRAAFADILDEPVGPT
jgi:hypothetical protein